MKRSRVSRISRSLAWTAAATGLLLLPWCAAAQFTIFSQGFEGLTGAATNLTDTSDADPDLPDLVVSDDDPFGSDPGSGVQLVSWDAAAGAQSLLVRSGSAAIVQLFQARSGATYQLDFQLKVVKGGGDRSFYVVVRAMGADTNGEDLLAYRSDRGTGASIWWYDGVSPDVGWKDTGASHVEDTWQHHRIVFDKAAQTMDLYIDDMDTPVVTGVDVSRSGAPVPVAITLQHEGNSADDGYCLFDDIALTVTDSSGASGPFTEGFEGYAAASSLPSAEDFDPGAPWVTVEANGTGTAAINPAKVQVVDDAVVPPHSGTQCLKLEGGQHAGSSFAWGTTTQSDVQITWWARVPASVAGTTALYLRMSLYCAEGGRTDQGDCALLGYGSRDSNVGDDTSLIIYNAGWQDTGADYTPDTWEQYRLTTDVANGVYSIVKDPDGAATEVATQLPFIGSAAKFGNAFMAAWSSSNGTGHPPVYIDDVEVKEITVEEPPPPNPYSATIDGGRFLSYSQVDVGGSVGDAVIDPADGTTIVFTLDDAAGGIYRAVKTGPGTWEVDPTPIVGGLGNPSGLAIDNDGALWWVHDFTPRLMRLRAPWDSNTPETIVEDFGDGTGADDDPVALVVTPETYSGSVGVPGWLAIADRGADDNAFNAIYLVDPTTTLTGQVGYTTYLIPPTMIGLGTADVNDIEIIPATGEVVALSDDGFFFAIDADGSIREIVPTDLYVTTPFGPNAEACFVDPMTGRLWIADDNLDQIWSVDPAESGQTPDQLEISFFMEGETRPDWKINFHDPSLVFADDGSFLVVSDTDTRNGGGRFFIFHSEVVPFMVTGISEIPEGIRIQWTASSDASSFTVRRGMNPGGDPPQFADISGPLGPTETHYVDTAPPADEAYYSVEKLP